MATFGPFMIHSKNLAEVNYFHLAELLEVKLMQKAEVLKS